MLYDSVENLGRYTGLSQNLDAAIQWVQSHDLDSLPPEITVISDAVYVNVMEVQPCPEEELCFEIHQKYTDLQLVLQGSELFQLCLSAPQEEDELVYDADADAALFNGTASTAGVLSAGRFAVFFAGEAHKPAIRAMGCDRVKKAVFKILAE